MGERVRDVTVGYYDDLAWTVPVSEEYAALLTSPTYSGTNYVVSVSRMMTEKSWSGETSEASCVVAEDVSGVKATVVAGGCLA